MAKSETKPVDLVVRRRYIDEDLYRFQFTLWPRHSRRHILESGYDFDSKEQAMGAGRRWAKRHGVTIANER